MDQFNQLLQKQEDLEILKDLGLMHYFILEI